MSKFTNEAIEINELPKFEEVQLKPLQSKYFTVVVVNRSIFNLVLLLAFSAFSYFKTELFSNRVWLIIGAVIACMIIFSYVLAKLSFNKKGFAFRTHDAIYKEGLISETTTIVPFNRVQHVALHQGFIARKLGLASIELFTAGGSSSDLEIPGLLLEEAQQIKNMVSQKINPSTEITEISSSENIILAENETND